MEKLAQICEDIAFDECEEFIEAQQVIENDSILVDRAFRPIAMNAVPVGGYIVCRKNDKDGLPKMRFTWLAGNEKYLLPREEGKDIVSAFQCKANRNGKKYFVKIDL